MSSQQLDPMELMLVEQTVANEAPSTTAAYLLAIFLGLLSAHRFYLRRPGSAVLQILSYFVLVGFVWWVIDLFQIPGMVRADRQKIRRREIGRVLAMRPLADDERESKAPPVDGAFVAGLLAARGLT